MPTFLTTHSYEGGLERKSRARTHKSKENRVFWRNMGGRGGLEPGLNNGVWILCMKTICGVKIKTVSRNVLRSAVDSKPYSGFVSACWLVVYSQLSAPQGHHTNRDSWGRGPSQAGTPWPLKSCHFRTAVHCSLRWSPVLPVQVENLAQAQVSSTCLLPDTHVHKCLRPFPFHTHLPNDERGDAFIPRTSFSHSRRGIKVKRRIKGWVRKLRGQSKAGVRGKQ